MKYFVDEVQRKNSQTSCYFEFQKGHYHNVCWLEDSINIYIELWDDFDLSNLFSQVVEDFDYYGLTTVNQAQWNKIVSIAYDEGNVWKKIVDEITPWVNECFCNHSVFTILGI